MCRTRERPPKELRCWRSSALRAGRDGVQLPHETAASCMDGTHAYQEGGHLVFGELGENLGQHSSSVGRHIAEDPEARLGSVNAHDPAILGAVASLYQPALLHAIDDPGRAGVGDVHRLGQLFHRERPFGLEGSQDVEMDEAESVPVPGLEYPATILWRPARHLLEQLSLEERTGWSPKDRGGVFKS